MSGTADAQGLRASDVDNRIKALGELQVIAFEFLLIFLLIGRDEIFVLLESIIASVEGKIKILIIESSRNLAEILLLREVLEAQTKLVLLFGDFDLSVGNAREENESHFHRSLIHCCSDAALQNHLQYLWI